MMNAQGLNPDEWNSLPKSRKEAKEQMSPTYFTGKVCKQGHVAPRRTHNGECKACQKKSDKLHRDKYRKQRNKSFRDWYWENRDGQLTKMKAWQQSNRKWFNQYETEKRQNNKQYRLAKSLRDRIYKAIERGDRAERTLVLLGCTIDELITHLEGQFSDGMTWDNYGDWHIDHIRPCVSFDLTDVEQQQQCFHFSNLQPLWEFDNKSKGGRWKKS